MAVVVLEIADTEDGRVDIKLTLDRRDRRDSNTHAEQIAADVLHFLGDYLAD
jgi:hypothetical protein